MGAFAGMTELLWTSQSASPGTARALVRKEDSTQKPKSTAGSGGKPPLARIEPPIHKNHANQSATVKTCLLKNLRSCGGSWEIENL